MIILSLIVFLVSAAALGLELVLVRSLSIAHWHHFAYLVISTALLGFGSSGTVITVAQNFFRKHFQKALWSFVLGFAVSIPAVFFIAQKLPFDQLRLVWDPRQVVYLLGYYLLFFIPFFFAGGCICLAFTSRPDKSYWLYFFNMFGSGLGAGGIVFIMYGHSPQNLLLVLSAVVFAGAFIAAWAISIRTSLVTLVCGLAVFVLFRPGGPLELTIRISENKSIVYYRSLPDSQTLATVYSPLARLDIIKAATIRYIPGLSINYQGPIPEQAALISDADGVSMICHFDNINDLKCYDHITSALPYHLFPESDVCIIGSGGGSDLGQALFLNARSITAVEMNPQTIKLLREQFGELASGIYNHSKVKIISAEGRSFLQSTPEQFDIIQISMLDSFTAGPAGLYALNESHLYTVEAIDKALDRLTPNGLLSITRTLKNPPRDSLKMLATVERVLRRRKISEPANHIIMVRSWATATIVVCPEPLDKDRISSVRRFCLDRRFDLVHLPGMEPQQANKFHILEEPIYFRTAREILGEDAESFFRDYVYHIRPATDDRPYFFDFLKWKALPHLIRSVGRNWLPYSEWGSLILIVTLVQAVIISGLFILGPLSFAGSVRSASGGKVLSALYFLLLGLAYMFLEMGFIQKMTLLIGHPVFGVAVTLTAFLVFSGCGSLVCAGLKLRPVTKIRTAAAIVIIIGVLEICLFNYAFDTLIGFGIVGRGLSALAVCAPLAFFMGIPFPAALTEIGRTNPSLVPWAWGLNGFASVTAAVLGTSLAVWQGFKILMFTALACYLLAAVISKKICR